MGIDFAKGGVADVADGVFVYVGPDGDSNNGIVLTGEGTISIDSFVRHYAGLTAALEHVGHGHCPGDLVVNFPERGVLFAGDLLFAGVHGRLKTADIDSLIAMLERLAGIACQTVIPGHGMPVKGIGKQAIDTYRDYLVELRTRITELIGNGVKPERIAAGLAGWKYANWGRAELFPVCAEHVYKDVAWRMRFSLDNPAQIMTRA